MNRLLVHLIACVMGVVLWPLSAAAAEEPKRATDLIRIEQVEVHASAMGPVVLLKARNKTIPVFVDHVVAESIQSALQGRKPRRPLTHDLMRTVLEKYSGKVTQAIITLKETTFYADLTVIVRGETQVFDSRSSDAIALCIHFKAPILVSQQLLDTAGKVLDVPDGIKL